MKPQEFATQEEGMAALESAPQGAILEPCRWRLRLPSWEERTEQEEYANEAVSVSLIAFSTRADLMELDDRDLMELGRMVVEMASWARRREQ